MRKNAPHLPAKTCRIDTYYRLQNVRWILLFALLAFVAGMSAALISVTWIVPQYDIVNVWTGNNRIMSYDRPDPFLQKQVEQRIFTIYDKRKKVAEKVYSEESFVGQSVVISSDGWLTTFVPDYFFGWEKNWEIVDYQNNVFKVEKVIWDDFFQILYFKIDTQGLRVMSFPVWDNLQIESSVWSVSRGMWKNNFIKEKNRINFDKSFYLWNEQFYYLLSEKFIVGGLLLDMQGNFFGFVDDNNLVVPGWFVENQVNNLLSNQALNYNYLNWKGYFVKIAKENGLLQEGFYLENVGNKMGASLKNKDIILKIDGKNVVPEDFSKDIWLLPDEFQVVVLRGEEELVFVVNKEKISL